MESMNTEPNSSSAASSTTKTAAATTTSLSPMVMKPANPPPAAVVELYQSQGCNSCPPANDNIIRLTEDPEMLVLTYEVTYWDQLGWKDTFGNIAFDERQREYGRALGNRGVYTPQVIVNGVVDGVGSTRSNLTSLLQRGTSHSASTYGSLSVTIDPSQSVVTVSGSVPANLPHAPVVYLIRYNPRTVDVHIPRGENAGRKLPHKNVVQSVAKLGTFVGGVGGGEEQSYATPDVAAAVSRSEGLKLAVLVQAGPGGAILGVSRG